MKNVLLDKGIILPSGEISKDKVNLVTGAITQPFAEMVWVTTGGDMETINRLTDILVSMNTPADRGKLFKIIKMLYGLMGLQFSEEAEPMFDSKKTVFRMLHEDMERQAVRRMVRQAQKEQQPHYKRKHKEQER